MYITSRGGVEEFFQISKVDAERAVAAFNEQSILAESDYFQFTTLFGRRCAINFKLVQAIHIYEDVEIASSTREIEGVLVHLSDRDKPLDILGDQEQISKLFGRLKTDDHVVQFGEWHFNTSTIVAVVASEAFTQPRHEHLGELEEARMHIDDEGYQGLKTMFKRNGLE